MPRPKGFSSPKKRKNDEKRQKQKQAINKANTNLDVPMANINIKQEIPAEIAQEVKQEIFDEPSEIDEMMALQEQQQQASTSTSTKTAPVRAKSSRVEELREKREIEALLKDREDRENHKRSLASILKNSIDPDTLPIPPGCAIVPAEPVQQPSSSKRLAKR